MTADVAYHKGSHALIIVGAGANIVVCIYAGILGVFNIIEALAEPRFLLLYIFMPLPFLLVNVFMEMRKELVPETHRGIIWHPWVWAASLLGIAVSLGAGGWLYLSISDWLSRGKSFDFTIYVMIGLPLSMFIAAVALLILLIRSVRA